MQSPAAILAQGMAGGEAWEHNSQVWPLDEWDAARGRERHAECSADL